MTIPASVEGHSTLGVAVPTAGADWLHTAHRARRLATFSLAWLCFGHRDHAAGILAGSVALVGHGLDGAIEVWRA